jgi:serine kinase of HPr protein (carbohydrate metabolism regulator)
VNEGGVLVHATAVARGEHGVLLLGPSGAGKSDLALRLIAGHQGGHEAAPFRLVADDQVVLRSTGGRLVATAPQAISGRLEVRGVGIISMPHVAQCEIKLAVELCAGDEIERLPDAATLCLAGHAIQMVRLAPFEASCPVKVALALSRAESGPDRS